MLTQIPIPTDNFSKFLALFGLLLFISVMMGTVYVQKSTNDTLVYYVEKIESQERLNSDPAKPGSQIMYERLIEIAIQDKKFYFISLGLVAGMGLIMMWVGFQKWHKYYQPKHDEILELTIEKLKADIEKANIRKNVA